MIEQIQLDCNACKTASSMIATKIARFSDIIRAIGVILLIPSFLGFGFAGLVFLSTVMATSDVMSHAQTDGAQAGAAIGSALGIGFSLFVGVISLVGGLLGWLLLLKRKVYKCLRCGYVFDRA